MLFVHFTVLAGGAAILIVLILIVLLDKIEADMTADDLITRAKNTILFGTAMEPSRNFSRFAMPGIQLII